MKKLFEKICKRLGFGDDKNAQSEKSKKQVVIAEQVGGKEEKSKKIWQRAIQGLILAIVIIIMYIKSPDLFGPQKSKIDSSQPIKTTVSTKSKTNTALQQDAPYEVQLEKRLKSILKKMQGVGEVEVMITTTYGKEIILAEDVTSHTSVTKEEDKEGGTREINNSDAQTKVVMQSENIATGNMPVVVKEKQPEIQGVLVIAEGAGNSMVKQAIMEATQTLLGVPVHRVTVHQYKTLNKK